MVSTAGLMQDWFRVTGPEPGVHVIEEPLHQERVKSFLIVGTERALLLDTGMGVGDIQEVVADLSDRPLIVVNSHAHWDHVGGNYRFADAELAIHRAEAPALMREVPNDRLRVAFAPSQLLGALPADFDLELALIPPSRPTRLLDGGETIELGGRSLDVIHAPGHSPGGIVLLDRAAGALFSTDVAYPGDLYCFNDDSDLDAYRASMARLSELAPALRTVYPSHGESPMEPALLPAMRAALDEIGHGRPPEKVEDRIAHWAYDGFAVLLPAPEVNR